MRLASLRDTLPSSRNISSLLHTLHWKLLNRKRPLLKLHLITLNHLRHKLHGERRLPPKLLETRVSPHLLERSKIPLTNLRQHQLPLILSRP
jgi:hypothetical protein